MITDLQVNSSCCILIIKSVHLNNCLLLCWLCRHNQIYLSCHCYICVAGRNTINKSQHIRGNSAVLKRLKHTHRNNQICPSIQVHCTKRIEILYWQFIFLLVIAPSFEFLARLAQILHVDLFLFISTYILETLRSASHYKLTMCAGVNFRL